MIIKKSLTMDITCPKCKTKLVVYRTTKNCIKTLGMCPSCGAGVKFIWRDEK